MVLCDINTVFVASNLVEPFTRLRWCCSRIAVTHPKSVQCACKVCSLIDRQHTLFSVLLAWQAKPIVNFTLILHVETFSQPFLFQCQQLCVIWSYQEIVDVYSGNYKAFLNMFVIDARVSITFEISRIFEQFNNCFVPASCCLLQSMQVFRILPTISGWSLSTKPSGCCM